MTPFVRNAEFRFSASEVEVGVLSELHHSTSTIGIGIQVLRLLVVVVICCATTATLEAQTELLTDSQVLKERSLLFESSFERAVRPFLKSYCYDCHDKSTQEAKLDLTLYQGTSQVASGHETWLTIRKRIVAGEMPPADAESQPTEAERRMMTDWIDGFRNLEAARHAGDPGPVLARRLSNAEYNYAVSDLTGVDIRPTATFPVDPANEAGFDNSGESLAMSPALLKKYLSAARLVVDHLVLKPDGFAFASHAVVTDTDRDKYCVRRIIEFYKRQPVDYSDYFFAAWEYRHRAAQGRPDETLDRTAERHGISPRYLRTLWDRLLTLNDPVGPLQRLRMVWDRLPVESSEAKNVRSDCDRMRNYVQELRPKLRREFPDLNLEGSHKGAQAFVLWKNRQYAAHRRLCNMDALTVDEKTDRDADRPLPDLLLPRDRKAQEVWRESYREFCSIFPDAFFVSERGRDYLGISRDEQEKGRLLSAGFHSMMGYFRDDGPLYDMLLSEAERSELDMLWKELNFIASAPIRQYSGFLWFERTDSRYLRDEEFDFARAEDKDSTSRAKISKLSRLYLDKAIRNGADETVRKAITRYFQDIEADIRWVEQVREDSVESHLRDLLLFASRAYRRPLSRAEQGKLLEFYTELRAQQELTHEHALQDCIVSVLMSPHFCYRVDLAGAGEGVRSLDDIELASRLSFFLWSSLPDEELLKIANEGRLHDPEVLRAQTARMLRDDRVRGMAIEFGANWLDFRRFEEHNSVDRDRFPKFTDELRSSMFEEPVRFLTAMMQNNESVLDCLYSERSFVNRELAQHYGLTHLELGENEWVSVDFEGSDHRGGLLPMAVFLTRNSPGLRTSPVKRGYWVVKRLLGEHIPPPPPDVPELPGDEAKSGELSLPEMLARHREHKSCAGCHDRFDSIGLMFENYGPVGEWRSHDLGGRQVQSKVSFPDGSERTGVVGLKLYLKQHREAEFVDNLCRKLLSYALGRSLILSDQLLIDEMKTRLESDDYRFGTLVEVIVSSPQFLRKRGSGRVVVNRESKEH